MRETLLLRTASLSGGTAIYMAGQLVLLILIARLGSPSLVGAYALVTAILNPLFLLARMGLKSAIATEQDGGSSYPTYRNLQYVLCAASVFITLAIVAVFLREPLVIYVTGVVFFAKLFETLSDLHYGLLIKSEMQHTVSKSLAIRSLAITVLYFLASLLTDAETAMMILPFSWCAVFFLYDQRKTRDLRALEGKTTSSEVVSLFYLVFPLALAGFFGQLSLSVPRYIIGVGDGAEILGQVAPALMAHVFVSSFADSIAQSILPTVSRRIAEGRNADAWRLLLKIAAMLLPLTLGVIALMFAVGPWIVEFVFGEGYGLAGALIGVVSVSWTLRAYGMLFGSAVLGARDFGDMFRVNLISLVAYSACSYGLGTVAGVDGVVWGIALGSLCYFVLLYLTARKRLLG